MGIFDGIAASKAALDTEAEYNKYMEQARMAQQQEMHRRIQAQNQMLGAPYGLGQQNAYGTQQGLLAQQYTAAARPEADFNPNDHEAWSMAMSTLVNLWRSKYLDAWVLPGNRSDEFWHHAYRRLAEAGKFERAPGSYIRLREDA